MNSRRKICFALLALFALAAAASCAGDIPKSQRFYALDNHWGQSFESAKSKQILNPEAGKNLDPVEGLDGQAAEGAEEQYLKAFQGKPAKRVYNLNLGTIQGIGEP